MSRADKWSWCPYWIEINPLVAPCILFCRCLWFLIQTKLLFWHRRLRRLHYERLKKASHRIHTVKPLFCPHFLIRNVWILFSALEEKKDNNTASWKTPIYSMQGKPGSVASLIIKHVNHAIMAGGWFKPLTTLSSVVSLPIKMALTPSTCNLLYQKFYWNKRK